MNKYDILDIYQECHMEYGVRVWSIIRYIRRTYYITRLFPRASGAAGPQSSHHRPLLNPPHLENHPVLSGVSPGVEGGGR